jgi:hypothetical protein
MDEILVRGAEQLVGPAEQLLGSLASARVTVAGRIGRHQPPTAMPADNGLSQIFHADLQTSTACRALLDEHRGIRHRSTSCKLAVIRRTQSSYDDSLWRSMTVFRIGKQRFHAGKVFVDRKKRSVRTR